MKFFDSPFSRRHFLGLMGAATLTSSCRSQSSQAATGGDNARKATAAFEVDFSQVAARVSPQHLGVCCTTYGRNPLSSPEQADAEAALDFRYVRLPVGIRAGRVTSSAAGGPTDLDMRRLVDWYRERGARVIAVLGGRTNDIDIAPGDAERIVRELGTDQIEYSSVNEPNNQKLKVEQAIEISRRTASEIARVKKDLKLWGPVWAWPEHPALLRWAREMDDRFAGISYHRYGMGVDSLSTEKAMSETPRWGSDVAELRAGLRDLKLPENVAVTELNFSWRFEDGTPPDGKNRRFFTAVNTVWAASALGHVLQAGGKAAIYGNQNGPLGVWTEANHSINQQEEALRGRAPSSPMPVYWGLAAWTGARRFPHFNERVFQVKRLAAPAEAELFAVDNEARGANLVMINKSETRTHFFGAALKGRASTRYDLWRTDPAKPFDAPRQIARDVALTASPVWEMPPLSVAVAVLQGA